MQSASQSKQVGDGGNLSTSYFKYPRTILEHKLTDFLPAPTKVSLGLWVRANDKGFPNSLKLGK